MFLKAHSMYIKLILPLTYRINESSYVLVVQIPGDLTLAGANSGINTCSVTIEFELLRYGVHVEDTTGTLFQPYAFSSVCYFRLSNFKIIFVCVRVCVESQSFHTPRDRTPPPAHPPNAKYKVWYSCDARWL